MTYCEIANPILGLIVGGFAGLAFALHLRAKTARIMGFAEGYHQCSEEWKGTLELKEHLDEKPS